MATNVRNRRLDTKGCKFISLERALRLRIGFSRPGDVLLTHKATVGETAIVPDDIPSDFIMLTPQVTYYRIFKPEQISVRFLCLAFQYTSIHCQLRYIGGSHWEVMKDPFTQIIAKQEGRWPDGMNRSRPTTNPESTRILVPMVVFGLKYLGITNPRTLVFQVEAISGLMIAASGAFSNRKEECVAMY
ncbi:MAG: hypothetical protein IID54_06125 [Proteobacteria bacterium]|nr:hypothetical protein [Pseudomonadota bacterium]